MDPPSPSTFPSSAPPAFKAAVRDFQNALVSEEVCFVHFSAKEYLFCAQVQGHLNRSQYTLRLASACLEVSETSAEWAEMMEALRELLTTRGNPEFVPKLELLEVHHLESFKLKDPEVYQLLCQETAFRKDLEFRPLRLGEVERWANHDPLTLRTVSARVNAALVESSDTEEHQGHEGSVNSDRLNIVRYNCSTRPLKCQFLGCKWFRDGFENLASHKMHFSNHAKPLYCPDRTCEYARIGFLSKRMRDKHHERHHKTDGLTLSEEVKTNVAAGDDEQLFLCLALIRANQAERLKSLITSDVKIRQEHGRLLLTEAASYGTCDIIPAIGKDLIIEISRQVKDSRSSLSEWDWFKDGIATDFILSPAIKAGNLEVAQWVADSDKEFKKDWGEEWGGNFVTFTRAFAVCLKSDMFLAFHKCLSPVFNRGDWNEAALAQVIRATSRCPEREGLLIASWKSTLEDKDLLSYTPEALADTTCSIYLSSA